jgi:hypothetical protein
VRRPEHGTVRKGRHKDVDRLGHLLSTVDRISNVVTADLVVDFGVFLTGCTLIFLELGFVPHRPFEDHEPPPVANIRTVPRQQASGH